MALPYKKGGYSKAELREANRFGGDTPTPGQIKQRDQYRSRGKGMFAPGGRARPGTTMSGFNPGGRGGGQIADMQQRQRDRWRQSGSPTGPTIKGFAAGRPDALGPNLTPDQVSRLLERHGGQSRGGRGRGRNTDRHYRDIIDSARSSGRFNRRTYGDTVGKRIKDRMGISDRRGMGMTPAPQRPSTGSAGGRGGMSQNEFRRRYGKMDGSRYGGGGSQQGQGQQQGGFGPGAGGGSVPFRGSGGYRMSTNPGFFNKNNGAYMQGGGFAPPRGRSWADQWGMNKGGGAARPTTGLAGGRPSRGRSGAIQGFAGGTDSLTLGPGRTARGTGTGRGAFAEGDVGRRRPPVNKMTPAPQRRRPADREDVPQPSLGRRRSGSRGRDVFFPGEALPGGNEPPLSPPGGGGGRRPGGVFPPPSRPVFPPPRPRRGPNRRRPSRSGSGRVDPSKRRKPLPRRKTGRGRYSLTPQEKRRRGLYAKRNKRLQEEARRRRSRRRSKYFGKSSAPRSRRR